MSIKDDKDNKDDKYNKYNEDNEKIQLQIKQKPVINTDHIIQI